MAARDSPRCKGVAPDQGISAMTVYTPVVECGPTGIEKVVPYPLNCVVPLCSWLNKAHLVCETTGGEGGHIDRPIVLSARACVAGGSQQEAQGRPKLDLAD